MTDRHTLGSLCTGYGGLDLAVSALIPTRTVWVCDNDPHVARLIARRHKAPNLGDIKTLDWHTVPRVDIITAGYPCQPFSQAGRRHGEKDPRHIWPHIAEGVQVLGPRVVVLENVQGHLTKGFGEVIGSLAEMGYDATWGCVRAAEAGAPHRRERVFIVATDTDRVARGTSDSVDRRSETMAQPRSVERAERLRSVEVATDTDGTRLEGHRGSLQGA